MTQREVWQADLDKLNAYVRDCDALLELEEGTFLVPEMLPPAVVQAYKHLVSLGMYEGWL